MAISREIRLRAPAKINLYLHVTGKRTDGYHDLDSLAAFAGVGDTLTIGPGEGLTLEVSGPRAADLSENQEADNIVYKAARTLAMRIGGAEARLRLEKNLPVAAGLGGGSADAAAALAALCDYWQVAPADVSLNELARDLGADVPVCLAARAAVMSGVGEVLKPVVSLPEAYLLLANPGSALSTAEVFRKLDGRFGPADPLAGDLTVLSDLVRALRARRNDLELPAGELTPAVGEALSALEALPSCLMARMSGSGATCFGLFEKLTEAEAGAAALARTWPGWWLCAAPLLADATEWSRAA